jgi:REP element-mobilizing transposase RayT
MDSGHQRLRRHRVSIAGRVYHVTACTQDRAKLFVDSVAFAVAPCCADPRVLQGSRMLAWTLMPDHVHWLLQLGPDDTLPRAVTRLKCATARASNLARNRSGQVWARAYHDHAVRHERALANVARYICMNAVRAGLASRPGDYPFWDAWWL